jgi:hypothetical protein
LQPANLGGEDSSAECGEAIVATALVVELRDRASLRLGHEAVGEEPLDDAVQVPGLEGHEPVGSVGDGLHESVAMSLFLGQREEELQVDGLEREEGSGVVGHGKRESGLDMIKMIIRRCPGVVSTPWGQFQGVRVVDRGRR